MPAGCSASAILLPLDIRWELLYRYSSPVKSAYGKRSKYHLLNASFTKRLFGDRLACKLALNGLLFNQKSRSVISTDDIYKSEAMYGWHLPDVSLSLFYNLNVGKRKQLKKMEHSNLQEKSRM